MENFPTFEYKVCELPDHTERLLERVKQSIREQKVVCLNISKD